MVILHGMFALAVRRGRRIWQKYENSSLSYDKYNAGTFRKDGKEKSPRKYQIEQVVLHNGEASAVDSLVSSKRPK